MIGLEIALEGEEWAPAFWRDRSNKFERDFERMLTGWARRIQAEIRRNAPVDTGQLQRSIYAYLTGVMGQHEILVDLGVPWGIYQEFGTGIHGEGEGAKKQPIRPIKAGVLRLSAERARSLGQASGSAQAYGMRPRADASFAPIAVTGYIFRMESQGAPALFFVKRTFQELEPQMLADLDMLLARHGFT